MNALYKKFAIDRALAQVYALRAYLKSCPQHEKTVAAEMFHQASDDYFDLLES